MSWTINNQSPASLNLRVMSITKNSDTASEAVLAVVSEDYTQQAVFSFDDVVSLSFNDEVVFSGTVFQTPRSIDSATEGLEYVLKDSWYELERLVYQVPRDYVQNVTPEEGDEDSEITFVSKYIGTTTFDSNVTLGARIKTIIDYANEKGLNIIAGEISSGVNWYRTESKDRTCAEMIREFLRLMPDLVAWIDTTTSPARFNLTERSSMPVQSYTLGTSGITGHSVVRHDSEKVEAVIIRYEKPVSIDSENYTEIIEDKAPANADPTTLNAFIETVGIQGGVYQNEYAPITTDTIPQADADSDSIKEWFIQYTPQLLAIKEIHGNKLRDFIKLAGADDLAQDIKKYSVKVIVNPLEVRKPLNPKATPIQQSTDPKDYPRVIVEGVLPEWASKRYRPVLTEATMYVDKAGLEAIGDADLKAALKSVFTVPKTIGGKETMTALFTGQVTGTNAVTKNYKRVVTSDPGESPPEGIAAELLEQLGQDRFSGEISLKGQEPDVITQVGQIVNVNGGRTEWASMNETIQQVKLDVQSGTTDISFGPPQNLGANDLIDRLRASRVNQFGYRMQSGNDIEEGLGGAVASPIFSFSILNSSTEAETSHPWKVILGEESGSTPATVTPGKIFKGILDDEEITPVLTEEAMAANTYMCLEYTYSPESVKNVVVSASSYSPITKVDDEVTKVTQIIAKAVLEGGSITIEQVARNNYTVAEACFTEGSQSTPIKYLMAL